ncbi:MAG: citrate (Si)-synthase, partial [Candidatus Puniceispirillaceae bacterium]
MSNLLSNNTITLTNNKSGDSCELPVISGSVGPDVIDIRKLYSQTGLFTFDPGYGATGSCLSGLTYIDGDQGILLHRGYPI